MEGTAKTKIGFVRRLLARTLVAFLAVNIALFLLPPFAWPVTGRTTSGFFFRTIPGRPFQPLEFHGAVDLAVPAGTPVRATAWGMVKETGTDRALGNYVVVAHPFGFTSVYGHLSSISVREGRLVLLPPLTPLGRSGSTGNSTGPHVHFELRLGGKPAWPGFFLFHHSLRRLALGV